MGKKALRMPLSFLDVPRGPSSVAFLRGSLPHGSALEARHLRASAFEVHAFVGLWRI